MGAGEEMDAHLFESLWLQSAGAAEMVDCGGHS